MRKRALVPLCVLLLVAGCATLQPGARVEVVRAEQALELATSSANAFLVLERAERNWLAACKPDAACKVVEPASYLNDAGVHALAERLRGAHCGLPPNLLAFERLERLKACDGTAYGTLAKLRDALRAYKIAPDDGAKLSAALASVLDLAHAVNAHLAKGD